MDLILNCVVFAWIKENITISIFTILLKLDELAVEVNKTGFMTIYFNILLLIKVASKFKKNNSIKEKVKDKPLTQTNVSSLVSCYVVVSS